MVNCAQIHSMLLEQFKIQNQIGLSTASTLHALQKHPESGKQWMQMID